MLAASLNRAAFEKAMDVGESEVSLLQALSAIRRKSEPSVKT
jgi:hypothetical protein